MPAAYSFDRRTHILKDCDHVMSSEDAARKYSVSITLGYNLRKQYKETGSIEPKKYKRGQKLGELCDVFSPKECQNYFKHAGYGKNNDSISTQDMI